jgi:hypothetical protein
MSGPPNNITQLRKFKSQQTAQRATGKTLCDSGFHQWAVTKHSQFDVKQGRLVTVEKCQRCATTRSTGR